VVAFSLSIAYCNALDLQEKCYYLEKPKLLCWVVQLKVRIYRETFTEKQIRINMNDNI